MINDHLRIDTIMSEKMTIIDWTNSSLCPAFVIAALYIYINIYIYIHNRLTLIALYRQSVLFPKMTFSHTTHDDVIKWIHFLRYLPFVRGIHRSPVSFPHKGQWRGALMFSLICPWINGGVNNREAGDLRRYRAHYDVNVKSHRFMPCDLTTTLRK